MANLKEMLADMQQRLGVLEQEIPEWEEHLARLYTERQGLAAMLEAAMPDTKRHITTDQSEVLLRDWAVQRGRSFAVADIVEELGLDMQGSTAGKRALNRLVKRGVLRASRGGLTAYTYVPPTGPGAAAKYAQSSPIGRGEGAAPVAGTGRQPKPIHRELRQLLQPAMRDGWMLEIPSGGGHPRIIKGMRVVTVPGTPGEGRALANCKAQLKREGVPV
jgi:predicted DNA-binding transcriptional regulator